MALVLPANEVSYAGNYTTFPALTLRPPVEGNKTIPAVFNWLAMGQPPAYSLRFNARLKSATPFTQIACVHVDNTRCASTVTLLFPDTGFAIELTSNTQGFYPVITNGLEFVAFLSTAPTAQDQTIIQVLNFLPPPIELGGAAGGGGVGTVREIDTVAPITGGPITDTGSISLSTPLAVNYGGTAAATGNAALDNLSGASGAVTGTLNRSGTGIWSVMAGMSTPISVPNGGTGQTTLPLNTVLKGNGAAAVAASTITDNGGGVVIGAPVPGGPQGAGTLIQPGVHVINANAAALPAGPGGTRVPVIHAGGLDGNNTAILLEAFGNPGGPVFDFRTSRGTAAAPTATLNGDSLGFVEWYARGASQWNLAATVSAVALENYTNSVSGSGISFNTCAVGTATLATRMEISQGVVIGNASTDPGQGGLVLNANAAVPPAAPNASTLLHLCGADATSTTAVMETFGGGGGSQFHLRASRGTAASPSPTMGTDTLGQILISGRDTSTTFNLGGQIYFQSVENWSATAHGTQCVIQTVAPGSTALNNSMILDGSGNLTIAGPTATKPGGGSWVAPSDRALKSSVTDWNTGLREILRLNPVGYRYGNDAWNHAHCDHIGLDAEDGAAVIPEMGRTVTLPIGPAPAEGQAQPTTEAAALDHGPLLFALVNAVKELTSRLEALEGAR